jgi:hypothetical protein
VSEYDKGLILGVLIGCASALTNVLFRPDATMGKLAFGLFFAAVAYSVVVLAAKAVGRHLRRRGVD